MIPHIHNLEVDLEKSKIGMFLERDINDAFPSLTDSRPTSNAYAGPMRALDSALSWIFFAWHREKSVKQIIPIIERLVERAAVLQKVAANQRLRRLHDIFLLQAAILCGSPRVMKMAVALTGNCDADSEQHAYEWGLVGLYKFGILGDSSGVERSLMLMRSSRPSPPYRMPSMSLTTAFALDKEKAFCAALARVFIKEWDQLETKEHGIIERGSEYVRVTLRERDPRNRWPWPEAALGKMAVLKGWQTPSDPLWCPHEFLTSFDT